MARHGDAGEHGEVVGVRDVDPDQARELAGGLLLGLPDRWRHTIAVARRAKELADAVDPGDREVLSAAAWLHDVGYSAGVADTGFHPLDGARFLDNRGWPPRLCALVAHHSGARFVARPLRLDLLLRTYRDEGSPVTDALAYAYQTVGARGEPLPIVECLADMLRRHGPGSPQAAAHHVRAPYLLAAAERVEQRLRAGGRRAMSPANAARSPGTYAIQAFGSDSRAD
jgi:putative nucleotidyltransferase with HDIG domain